MNEALLVAGCLATAMAAALAWAAVLWWGRERRQDLDRLAAAMEDRVSALQGELDTLRRVSSPEVHERLSQALASSAGYIRQLEARIETYERTLREYREAELGKAAGERDRIRRGLSEVAGRFEELGSAVDALRDVDERLDVLHRADEPADPDRAPDEADAPRRPEPVPSRDR